VLNALVSKMCSAL